MKKFEVIFYETLDGECPIEEFQDSLDKKMRVNSGRKRKYVERTL